MRSVRFVFECVCSGCGLLLTSEKLFFFCLPPLEKSMIIQVSALMTSSFCLLLVVFVRVCVVVVIILVLEVTYIQVTVQCYSWSARFHRNDEIHANF